MESWNKETNASLGGLDDHDFGEHRADRLKNKKCTRQRHILIELENKFQCKHKGILIKLKGRSQCKNIDILVELGGKIQDCSRTVGKG